MSSRTYQERETLFQPGEFVWADSAYPLTTWSVSPYVQPDVNVRLNRRFNFALSHVSLPT